MADESELVTLRRRQATERPSSAAVRPALPQRFRQAAQHPLIRRVESEKGKFAITDETPTATPTVAPSDRPDAQSVGNTVAVLLGVLALIATVALLLWAWAMGDVWPSLPQGHAILPCLPNIDHHCLP